jgi:uncharacterized membrane protein YdcZ (DUF606 family)
MGVAIIVAVGIGLAVAAQAAILGGASRSIHPLAVSLALQASGLLVGAIWALWDRTWPQVGEVIGAWWWIPLGALGWGIVAALGFSSARLGASITLAIVVAAQVIGALVLDVASGRVETGLHQPVGAALLVGGVILITAPWR